MANIRDKARDDYVYAERNKGRTFKDIAAGLGISPGRVRQIYVRACKDRRKWTPK